VSDLATVFRRGDRGSRAATGSARKYRYPCLGDRCWCWKHQRSAAAEAPLAGPRSDCGRYRIRHQNFFRHTHLACSSLMRGGENSMTTGVHYWVTVDTRLHVLGDLFGHALQHGDRRLIEQRAKLRPPAGSDLSGEQRAHQSALGELFSARRGERHAKEIRPARPAPANRVRARSGCSRWCWGLAAICGRALSSIMICRRCFGATSTCSNIWAGCRRQFMQRAWIRERTQAQTNRLQFAAIGYKSKCC